MSEHTTITDRINALRPYPDSGFGELVKLSDVLEIVKNAVPVEIDPTMYADEHVGALVERDRKTLAVVSTVYNLLADTAAEFAAEHVRRKMEARGLELLSDAELFAHNKAEGNGGGATSYRDLAHRSEAVVMAIGELFDFLENVSIEQAELGLQVSNSILGGEDVSLEGLAKALDIHFGEGR